MHTLHSAFVLGYHGCDRDVGERLLKGEKFKKSDNDYDWLGHGIYFWEANPIRGLEFAREVEKRGKSSNIKEPYVIGAIIDLGLCLDLMTSSGIAVLKEAYSTLDFMFDLYGKALPKNSEDRLRRKLDCAVMNYVHEIRDDNGDSPIDTIKGVFVEGGPVYPGAGFEVKNHIQICVRTPDCIKGVFRVEPRFLK